MSFASPERLMWLAVALPIVGFYILKTRLRRKSVATLLFWDQVFEEKRQRSLWQNLRHWLSLLLQLALVGLLAFALADPLWRSQTDSAQELILVLDNSASMQAVDPDSGRSRLEEAIEEARQLATGLRQGNQIALITAGSSVRVAMGMTDFSPAIDDALQDVLPTDGPTRVIEAIEAARRLSTDPERRRIVVISDVCLDDRDNVPEAEDLRWVQVGATQQNVAITTFQARRSTIDPVGFALLIEVQNFSEDPARGRLKLELDQSLVDVIPFELEPNETWRTTIDGTSTEGGVLVGTIDSQDALAIDNVARAIVPARPLIPVTLVSEGESEAFYLRTVLDSIPLLQVTLDGDTEGDRGGLKVFNGTFPDPLPDGPLMIVAPQQDGPKIDVDGLTTPAWIVGKPIDSPIIAKQDRDSPLMRHVQLQNVLLDGGRDIEVNDRLGEPTTLLETADGARVLVSVERPSGRILILSTDLDSSDLPLRIAFPVMMTNAVNWFFRRSGEMNPAIKTGQVTTVPWDVASEASTAAVLIDSSGSHRVATVDKKVASVGPLADVGVYGLFEAETLPTNGQSGTDQSGTGQSGTDQSGTSQSDEVPMNAETLLSEVSDVKGELLAVNLCDASESDLRLPDLAESVTGDLPSGGLPAWFYLVMLAIGLVVSEWVLFNRRIVA